jgi:hypothetical protein
VAFLTPRVRAVSPSPPAVAQHGQLKGYRQGARALSLKVSVHKIRGRQRPQLPFRVMMGESSHSGPGLPLAPIGL